MKKIMRVPVLVIFILSFLEFKTIYSDYPEKRVISVPVANLRYEPIDVTPETTLPASDLDNPIQITQLLLGEHIVAYEELVDSNNITWLKVHALNQEKFLGPSGWIGYPGWIKKADTILVDEYPACNLIVKAMTAEIRSVDGQPIYTVSLGSRLKGIDLENNVWLLELPDRTIGCIAQDAVYQISQEVTESIEELRESIVRTSYQFLNNWYSWGGRSAQSQIFGNISSVDCSALINLSFLVHGLEIPRMSKEQFLASTEIISGKELQPGDFIYFASIYKNPHLIDHIMMYIGDNKLIEATFSDDRKIRITDCDTRIGRHCDNIKSGEIISYMSEDYFVYFSTLFNNQETLQKLRNKCINNSYNL